MSMQRKTSFPSRAALASLAVWLLAPDAGAVTCTVTSTADSGSGTLREKVADPTCDIISLNVSGVIVTSGSLAIARNLTITGPGPAILTIQGSQDPNSGFPIFRTSSGIVSISGLSITNTMMPTDGVITNLGATLTVDNVTFSGNQSQGAILNQSGALTVSNSRFSGNSNNRFGDLGAPAIMMNGGSAAITGTTFSNNVSAGGFGGALTSYGGSFAITKSTFTANSSDVAGAAIYSLDPLSVADSTFSGNSAYIGGAIALFSTTAIRSSTFSGNTASEGGAVYGECANATITDSTFSANSAGAGSAIATVIASFCAPSSYTIVNSTISGGDSAAIWNPGGGADAKEHHRRRRRFHSRLYGRSHHRWWREY